MCGRFFLADSDNSGELRSIIDQLNRRGATVKTGEIFPTDTVPVLANNRNRRVMPFPMQWGYTLPDGRLLINARSETAGESGKSAAGRKSSTPSDRRMQVCYTWRGCTAWRTGAQCSPF